MTMKVLPFLLAAALLAGCQATPPASAPSAPPAAEIKFDPATADRLVAERHWSELFKLHTELRSAEDMRRSLDWSRDHLMGGGTVFIGLPYAVNLWRVANSAPVGSKLQELKETGSVVGLYGLAVILVDGYRCADRTSAGERATDWIQSFHDPFQHAAALPKETRDKLVDTALRMESGTAARRQDDPWLCGAGMERMTAAIDAMKQSGAPPREVPTPLGAVARTFELQEAPAWTPSFVSRQEAEPKEAAARQNLPQVLNGLLDRVTERRAS
jgi:hypothetical protein